jgi:adenylate cyclase
VERYPTREAARRAGVGPDYVDRLVELGLLEADANGELGERDVRRAIVIHSLEQAGIPLEGLAELVRRGAFSLEFVDARGYDAFAPLTLDTFGQASLRSGVPLELLLAIREVTGGLPASPDDEIRSDEQPIVALVELHHQQGFSQLAMERQLRVYGDSLRRIAEAEAEWWRSEVQNRILADGGSDADIARTARDLVPQLAPVLDESLLAIYHAQQRLAWGVNIIGLITIALQRAGLYTRVERPPAMCFIDITGFTRLTEEQGDNAAADMAERLARVVQRTAAQHGGRAVKWLGDGVMLYFPEAGRGAVAALDIMQRVTDERLPPAHGGLHAGPVVFQEGDYYGQTVNVAARIGEYARPGEVLVSHDVVKLANEAPVRFREIGPVDLRGVTGAMRLYEALR